MSDTRSAWSAADAGPIANQPRLLIRRDKQDAAADECLMRQEQDIGQHLVQPGAQRRRHVNRIVVKSNGVTQRQLQVGLIFLDVKPPETHAPCFEVNGQFGRERVEIADNPVGLQAQGQHMPRAAVDADDGAGRRNVRGDPLTGLKLAVGENKGSHL